MLMARPARWSIRIGTVILERLTRGWSLQKICRRKYMPLISTVMKRANEDKAFSEHYREAQRLRADAIFDEIIDIADDAGADTYIDANGVLRVQGEVIQRAKLRIHARQWI